MQLFIIFVIMQSKESKENKDFIKGDWMQKVKEAILSTKGQITVPKKVREILGVKNGDAIAFYFENNTVKLTGTKNLNVKLYNTKNVGEVKGERKNG